MEQKILLSICIPSYKRPKEVQETIESIVCQFDGTIEKVIEVVISDDAGSDVSAVIRPLAERYPQIRYSQNEKNMRFANGLKANSLGRGEYLLSLSNDDSLTNFSLRYILEIIEKTHFDFLLHKPVFTTDVHMQVTQTENTYETCHGIREYLNKLLVREQTYNGLVSYFSFNSVMICKASYRNDSYNKIDKVKVFSNEFPQEFPPYYDLKDKVIILANATFLKGRLLNACYRGSWKLVESFRETMDFIEQQNELHGFEPWMRIKKICVRGWTRTMIIGIIISRLGLDYKKSGFMRWVYKLFKKYIQ